MDRMDVAMMTTSGCCARARGVGITQRQRKHSKTVRNGERARLLHKVVRVGKEAHAHRGGSCGVVRARGGDDLVRSGARGQPSAQRSERTCEA